MTEGCLLGPGDWCHFGADKLGCSLPRRGAAVRGAASVAASTTSPIQQTLPSPSALSTSAFLAICAAFDEACRGLPMTALHADVATSSDYAVYDGDRLVALQRWNLSATCSAFGAPCRIPSA
jgi:hypothetical protein